MWIMPYNICRSEVVLEARPSVVCADAAERAVLCFVCLMYCSNFGLVCQLVSARSGGCEPASVPEVSQGSAWHPRSHNTAGRGCCRWCWCQLTAASEREQSAACINTEYGPQLPVSHHGVTLRDQRGTWLIMNASNITDSANMTSGPPGTADMDKALYRTLAQVSVRIISFCDHWPADFLWRSPSRNVS